MVVCTDSKLLNGLNEKLGGVMCIRYNKEDKSGDFLWSHTTNSMVIGYMNSNDKSAKVKQMENFSIFFYENVFQIFTFFQGSHVYFTHK